MVDGPCGVDAIPFDVVYGNPSKKTMHPTFEDVRDYTENREAWEISVRDGYGARMSAPGYSANFGSGAAMKAKAVGLLLPDFKVPELFAA
jgi:predicted ATPase with chaperone activity